MFIICLLNYFYYICITIKQINIMKTFQDVKINQEFFISRTGTPMIKLSETVAQQTTLEYCGFDFQDVRQPKPKTMALDERVYL